MARESILVVEDEADILELICYHLVRDGYRVTRLDSGEKVCETAQKINPDLILLDLMLPGMDGFEVCRQLKQAQQTRSIPIVMLTARGEEADTVAGLELGADDYIVKPFSPRVLMARLRTVLRRKTVPPDEETAVLKIHGIEIHPGRHEVLVKGRPVQLTYTEFKLLHVLARRPGWVFSRDQIVDAVRGADYAVTDRAVDVQIVGLRKKLGAHGRLIETMRGVGYRFKEQ